MLGVLGSTALLGASFCARPVGVEMTTGGLVCFICMVIFCWMVLILGWQYEQGIVLPYAFFALYMVLVVARLGWRYG